MKTIIEGDVKGLKSRHLTYLIRLANTFRSHPRPPRSRGWWDRGPFSAAIENHVEKRIDADSVICS
jgi:hypothetical protein